MTDDKIRENRLRRMAQRQGLQLSRSKRRDPRATDYGAYRIIDPDHNVVVAGGHSPTGLDLDGVERYLTTGHAGPPTAHDRNHQNPASIAKEREFEETPHLPSVGVLSPRPRSRWR